MRGRNAPELAGRLALPSKPDGKSAIGVPNEAERFGPPAWIGSRVIDRLNNSTAKRFVDHWLPQKPITL